MPVPLVVVTGGPSRPEEQRGEVPSEVEQQDETYETGGPEVEEEHQHQRGRPDHHGAVTVDYVTGAPNLDGSRDASEDDADVEEIRADDVGDGDVTGSDQCDVHADRDLRGGRPECDDGESDDEFREAEVARLGRRVVDETFRTGPECPYAEREDD